MCRHVIGLVAFDLILRLIRRGPASMALVIEILVMNPDDPAADPSCLGIPAYVISDGKSAHVRPPIQMKCSGRRNVPPGFLLISRIRPAKTTKDSPWIRRTGSAGFCIGMLRVRQCPHMLDHRCRSQAFRGGPASCSWVNRHHQMMQDSAKCFDDRALAQPSSH